MGAGQCCPLAMSEDQGITRRDFIRRAAGAAGAAAAVHSFAILGDENNGAGRTIKVGIIGCGGRGTHDTSKCVDAGRFLNLDVRVTATADSFRDKAVVLGKRFGVPEKKCFGGYDGYRKLLQEDVDLVLMATPPNFRPLHFEAAIKEGKHVFMEKPIAVDPPGARKVMEMGAVAREKGLAVGAGTQRRHAQNYRKTQYLVAQGAIGQITGGAIYWCGGKLWFKPKQANWDDATYLVRNWVSFVEMSGDFLGNYRGRPVYGEDYFKRTMNQLKRTVLLRSHQAYIKSVIFDKLCLTLMTSHAYKPERIIAIADLEKPSIKTVDDLEILAI